MTRICPKCQQSRDVAEFKSWNVRCKSCLSDYRAQLAAARAVNKGQPVTPPAQTTQPPTSTASTAWGTQQRRRRRRSRGNYSAPASAPAAPIFNTPKPTYRAQKLAALVALESVFVQKLAEQGITQDIRDAHAKYKLLKTRALASVNGNVSTAVAAGTQAEADVALKLATVQLVKLAF